MDAIANWVWQGIAIATAATLVLGAASRRISATTRYRLWWITLATVLLLPFLPLLSLMDDGQALHRDVVPAPYSVPMPALPWWPAMLLTTVWIVWATWSLVRTAHALAALRNAKRRSRAFPRDLEATLTCWNSVRHQGRQARLVVSPDIHVAAVLGLGSPAIALSPAALRELEAGELEAIILHEWAHVQRRDDVARFVQLIVRAVAGLHPAIWWIDRQLQIDRETACDDWAINLTGSAKAYAACLTKLASLSHTVPDATLLPAALSSSELTSSDFTRRVVRLLDRHRSTSTKRPIAATALVLPVMMLLAAIVGNVQLVATASPTATPSSDGGAIGFASERSQPVSNVEPVRAGSPTVREQSARTVERQPERAVIQVPVTLPEATAREAAELQPRKPISELQPMPLQALGAPDDLPGTQTPVGNMASTSQIVQGSRAADGPAAVTPWGAAAGAGVSVGRGSQKAAVATAGFFTKLSKSIADVF